MTDSASQVSHSLKKIACHGACNHPQQFKVGVHTCFHAGAIKLAVIALSASRLTFCMLQ